MKWNKIYRKINGLKDVVSLSIANIVATGIGGFFWFYVATLVGEESYGEISYYLSIAAIGSGIAMLGASNTLVVYAAKGEKILPIMSLITLSLSSISAIIIYFIFNNLGSALHVFTYVIFGLITAEFLGRKFYRLYSKYIILQKIMMVILSLVFFYFIGFNGIIIGIALSFLIIIRPMINELKNSSFNLKILNSKKNFILNNYVLELSRMFGNSMDKIIIVPIFGFAILGNYQLGIQFYMIFLIIPSVIYQYILPQDAIGNPNLLLKKIVVICSIVISLVSALLSPIIVTQIFPEFQEAVKIIQIMSIAVIPGTINYIYISKFLGNLKGKIVLIGSGIFLVTIILGIVILGELLYSEGLAISFVIAKSAESLYLFSANLKNRNKVK